MTAAAAGRGAWVSAAVAARRLGVHVRTVRRWVRRGVMRGACVPCYQDGRCRVFVARDDLAAWLEQKRS